MTYDEALAWLYGTQLHGIRLGLEPIRRLAEALGIKLSGPEAPKFLHVAGTNGKGSVCAMLDAICRAAGRRTGLFTSPHLVTFRERIRLDGEMIPEGDVAEGLSAIRAIVAEWEHSPTFFEITTALALAWFQKRGAEVAVLETGMGGRLDATNAVTPAVSIITPIDLDHQQWLGATLAQIAAEKAGIIKAGVPVVCAPQEDEARCVLLHLAYERDATLHLVSSALRGLPIALAGSHQQWNAALAVHALEVAEIACSGAAIGRGLREVEWPGRFQRIGEKLVLDGAHNPGAARRLAETWREVYREEKAAVVLGILQDKDVHGICEALLPIAACVIAVPVRNERTSGPESILAVLRTLNGEARCDTAADLLTALERAGASGHRVLVTGSLFLVGEALAQLDGVRSVEHSAQ